MERNVIIKTEGIKQERVDFGGYKLKMRINFSKMKQNSKLMKLNQKTAPLHKQQ